MYNINSFTFTLPVKIFQICVNIILWGVRKLASAMFALLGVPYRLGYRLSRLEIVGQAKLIFRDSAKIIQDILQLTGKT